MKKGFRRGLAAALCAVLAFSALTGCSKKKDKFDAKADMLTLKDTGSISAGAANLLLRYEQAEFENGIGQFLKSYYGDLWNSDFSGSGEAYGNTFKTQILETMQHMLLAKSHAEEFGVELTDDEKSAITKAASDFIAANDEEVLAKMSATQESAEVMLTMYTIMTKMETAMSADVDTEVSDEEAAQRTISYVYFTATTEAETEEESELPEEISESVEEAAGALAEEVSEAVSEAGQALAEAESEVKTKSADKSETEPEEAPEAVTEAAEAATEEVGENAAEDITEAETETESPEMLAARAEALARAEAFLARVQAGADFEEEAQAAMNDETQHAVHDDYTFGDSDTYPDAAIREATVGLEDGQLVDHVIQVGTSYYVVLVEDAFDEEATLDKKDQIVENRRSEAINAYYDEWTESAEFSLDQDAWTSLVFDIALNYPSEEETEGLSEAAEAISEGENVAESATEK